MADFPLIATRNLRYAGQSLVPGAPFSARTARDATLLKAVGKAKDATRVPAPPPPAAPIASTPITPDAPAQEPAVDVPAEASDWEPTTPDEPEPASDVPSPPKVAGPMRTRRYLRKDLTPER